MPTLSTDTPIRQLVIESPGRARIFEHLGVDYCCTGDRSLAEACREKDLDPDTVAQMLDAAAETTTEEAIDWTDASLSALIDHIEATHHDYLRRELPRLERLLTKVVRAHGTDISWLEPTLDLFQTLKSDLEAHTQSEEEHVFPAIRTLEVGRVLPDGSTLGEVPLEQMEAEHDEAGSALQQLRTLTNDYTPPEGACATFQAAMGGLRELEADMHRHVHKENNILFPRARSLTS